MGVRLPTEYQEVEWIESRSRTQWIDTGVQPSTDSNFKIFLCAMRLSNPGGQGNYFYGTSGNWCSMECYSSKLNWNTGSSTHAVLIDAPIINSKFSIAIDYSNNRMTLSGFYSGSVRYSGTLGSGNLVIFAQKANTSMSQLRLYACKIWQGNKHQLVRDYVPCYRKSDNKPGLYDLVTKTFFVNQGTGEFAVGLDVIDSISPWLVARRRMLMRKPLVDTSPKISTYGKRLYGVSGTSNNASCCITEFYDVETIPTVQGRIVLGTPAVGSQSNFQCWNDSGAIDYAEKAYPYLYVGTTRIRFTLLIDSIDDSYAYNPDDGQIWFAGKNTIYYGYTNINDMPIGT